MKGNTVSNSSTALKNRIIKNYKKLKSYIQKNRIEAYRLYSKDIPEYPYLIDIYGNHAVIYEQGKKLNEEDLDKRNSHQNDIENVLREVANISPEFQHFKIREKQKGNLQYRPLDPKSRDFFPINENGQPDYQNGKWYIVMNEFIKWTMK
jgi:23S rRNA (cytosine1962-C5)-methyltransferase/23S rRNA (guanine2445-N2)-methyltransferase / 23S rRNA (guanine2069-N7)-methyltransferase